MELSPRLDLATDDEPRVTGAPIATAPPTTSGTPNVGQTLTVTNGSYTNSPTGFTEQWMSGGVYVVGQTGATYVVRSADLHQTITVLEVATNAVGGGGAISAGTAITA